MAESSQASSSPSPAGSSSSSSQSSSSSEGESDDNTAAQPAKEPATKPVPVTSDKERDDAARDSRARQKQPAGDLHVSEGQAQPQQYGEGDLKQRKKVKRKRLSAAETARRGVVYINRPPPYMRPDKVRHLLQQYADVTRIFLQPEDETIRRRRRKEGGNRRQRYKEGWVEFADRKEVRGSACVPVRVRERVNSLVSGWGARMGVRPTQSTGLVGLISTAGRRKR